MAKRGKLRQTTVPALCAWGQLTEGEKQDLC